MIIGKKNFKAGDRVMLLSPKSAGYYFDGDPGAEEERAIGMTGVILRESTELDNPFAAAVLKVDEAFISEYPDGKFLLCCDDEIVMIDSG